MKTELELCRYVGAGPSPLSYIIYDELFEVGGEGGIRTRVGVFSPQTAFEAAPLRPLRYLSGVVSVKVAGCQNDSSLPTASLKKLSKQCRCFLFHNARDYFETMI